MPSPKRTFTFSPKALKAIHGAVTFYSQSQHEWIRESHLELALSRNVFLMRELYRAANNDPVLVRQFLLQSAGFIRQNARFLQSQRNLPSSHPAAIISNIYHPLNPNNPRNLMLNPVMNMLFVQYLNTQAAILDSEVEDTAENKLTDEQWRNEILENGVLMEHVRHELANNPELQANPHLKLGVAREASRAEIEAAFAAQVAEAAPRSHRLLSQHFIEVLAAGMLLLGWIPHPHPAPHREPQPTYQPHSAGRAGG